ncbi:MAG: hypothetical protein HYS27_23600 [Deltaproteobacteria bacterium]|nr:hypothetical protein [Deltaproteobacteria bacterium]
MKLVVWSLLAVLLFTSACPGKLEPAPHVVDAGAAPVAVVLKRPPFPNLATAAYGQRVLEERSAALPPDATGTVAATLAALHDVAPGSEQRAAVLGLAAARGAKTEAERATALALASAALVLDPVVEGYQERLTDAFGLAAYAATLDQSDNVAQGARALVGAAAGAVAQARGLIKSVDDNPVPAAVSADVRLLLALSRRVIGDRGDALVADLRAVLKANPTSLRARALLAEHLLELGLFDEAIAAAGSPPVAPWLAAVAARARVLKGEVAEGIAALRDIEGKVDEGRRGEVIYWLARSLTQTPDGAAEVQSLASALAPRPGFAKESKVLEALLAQVAGDYTKARTLLEPLVPGPPRLPVDVDALWLLVDACAGQGDLPCVEKAGAVVLEVDGDEGRLQVARAASVLVGKTDGAAPEAAAKSVLEAFREAHRLTPFDDKLAAKVGEPVVGGGAAAAARVRAARRALARGGAGGLVEEALAPVKDAACRACRALAAAATLDGQEGARRALKALDGAGPPLAESDLIRVIDALGGFPMDGVRAALAGLEVDARPRVKQAVAKAKADLQDPNARARRGIEAQHQHGAKP